MKKIILLILTITALTFVGCDSDEDVVPTPVVPTPVVPTPVVPTPTPVTPEPIEETVTMEEFKTNSFR